MKVKKKYKGYAQKMGDVITGLINAQLNFTALKLKFSRDSFAFLEKKQKAKSVSKIRKEFSNGSQSKTIFNLLYSRLKIKGITSKEKIAETLIISQKLNFLLKIICVKAVIFKPGSAMIAVSSISDLKNLKNKNPSK